MLRDDLSSALCIFQVIFQLKPFIAGDDGMNFIKTKNGDPDIFFFDCREINFINGN